MSRASGARGGSAGFHLGLSGAFLDQPMVGSGQYVRNLLRELLKIHRGRLTVFCPTRSSYVAADELLAGAGRGVGRVHDLIPVVVPAHRGSLLTQAYTGLACAGVRRARLIIADSAYSKRDILDYLKIPPERIRVIHLAAESRYQPVADESELERVRQRYDLNAPFVFYVGGLERRKNVPALIDAFAEAPPPWRLAIGGEPYRGRGRL